MTTGDDSVMAFSILSEFYGTIEKRRPDLYDRVFDLSFSEMAPILDKEFDTDFCYSGVCPDMSGAIATWTAMMEDQNG